LENSLIKRLGDEFFVASGRPIVIAAHSQGTEHAVHLLEDFFKDIFSFPLRIIF